MTKSENKRLLRLWYAKTHAPTYNVVSRRVAKGKSNATNQVLKSSRVSTQVPLELVLHNETVKQRMIAERPS